MFKIFLGFLFNFYVFSVLGMGLEKMVILDIVMVKILLFCDNLRVLRVV